MKTKSVRFTLYRSNSHSLNLVSSLIYLCTRKFVVATYGGASNQLTTSLGAQIIIGRLIQFATNWLACIQNFVTSCTQLLKLIQIK